MEMEGEMEGAAGEGAAQLDRKAAPKRKKEKKRKASSSGSDTDSFSDSSSSSSSSSRCPPTARAGCNRHSVCCVCSEREKKRRKKDKKSKKSKKKKKSKKSKKSKSKKSKKEKRAPPEEPDADEKLDDAAPRDTTWLPGRRATDKGLVQHQGTHTAGAPVESWGALLQPHRSTSTR